MVRNYSPAAWDKFACPGRNLFAAPGGPDPALFAAAVKFMMDPKFAGHPLSQEIDSAAQVDQARGNPKDPCRKQLIPVAEGEHRSAIKSRGSKCDEAGQEGDGDPCGGQIKQGLRSRKPVGQVWSGQRPAEEYAGKQEASGVEEGEQVKVTVKAGAIPDDQRVEDCRHLPDPEDTDTQDPVQPGHRREPAGHAKSEAARGFRPLSHRQYGERRGYQQKRNMTCYM